MNFTSMGSCAGRPEINASSACPCDSPAVQNFSIGADALTYSCFWLDKNKQFICLCASRPARPLFRLCVTFGRNLFSAASSQCRSNDLSRTTAQDRTRTWRKHFRDLLEQVG